jgi:DNA-binding NarL/FixJ family response regulator
LIVTEHEALGASLKALMGLTDHLTVGANAADLTEARRLVSQRTFDLALVDWLQLPALGQTMKPLFPAQPELPVILMTMHDEFSQTKLVRSSGIRGIVTEHTMAEELREAIQEVLAGRCYLSRDLLSGLTDDERDALLAMDDET